MTVRERPDDPRSPPDLLHDPLQRIVGSDLAPMAVRKAVKGQCLANALHKFSAGVGDDQLHTAQTPVNQMAQKVRPAGLVFLGALANAKDLPVTFGIHRTGHQQRDIPDFSGPRPLHHDPIQVKIGMLAFDRTVPPFLDLGIDLLVQIGNRTGTDTRAP